MCCVRLNKYSLFILSVTVQLFLNTFWYSPPRSLVYCAGLLFIAAASILYTMVSNDIPL